MQPIIIDGATNSGAIHWNIGCPFRIDFSAAPNILLEANIIPIHFWSVLDKEMYGNCRGYGETESPSRARPRSRQKSENLLLYYGVDLALEKSNPLTTHIVLAWKYSIEWFF